MKNRIARIIGFLIIIIIGFAFQSSSLALTTIMTEGAFAKYVRNHKEWFWGDMDEGILAKSGKTAYFGKNLTPGDEAACQTNGACLYHLEKHIGEGSNYHSCITNLVEFDGKTGKITIYGGKDIKRTSQETISWTNANAVAKILYDAYEKKGNTSQPSSVWGASVSHAINQTRSKIESKVHPYFFTDSNRVAYTTEQKEKAEKKYNAATKLKPIGSSSISFQDTSPMISTAKEGNTTYTYIGPFKISGSGTIDDILVGSYKYSGGAVRWSTTANKSGLKTGKAITPNTNFYLRVKANLSSTKSIKVTINTKGGEYYKARMALITYLCGTCTKTFSSQNLGIYSAKKVTVDAKSASKTVMNTAGLEIIKQDQDTGARLAGVTVKVTGPNKYDKTFTTDSNGSIAIYDLPAGTYVITETSNPHYGYTTMVSTSATVGSSVVKAILNNQRQTGNLIINKVDEDTGAALGGVSLKIRNSNGQYLRAVSNGIESKVVGKIVLTNLETTPYPWEATEFVTASNGMVEIQNILAGQYTVEEVFNPYYGYTQMVYDTVNVTRTATATLTLKNPKQTGNLRIYKIDKDSKVPLEGVSFKIKGTNGNYIIAESNNTKQSKVTGSVLLSNLYYTANEKEATEFITDSNGIIEIHNLLIDTYQVIEVSIGKNTAYEIDDDYITWESNLNNDGKGRIAQVKVNRQASNNTQDATNGNVDTVTVKNRRKYVNLGGYVWQDIEFDNLKDQMIRNGLWNEENTNDKFDQRLEGIEVILRNKDGVIQLTNAEGKTEDAIKYTNNAGEYEFQRIVIDDLPTLYVEFSYNGMSYQSVVLHLDKDNGSKAAEGEQRRKKFNSEYETITYGGSNQHTLDYNTSNYESKLKFGNEANYNYGYEDKSEEAREDRGPVNGVDDIFMLLADTYQAYVKADGTGGYLDDIKSPEEIRKEGIAKIENVNLGIEKREQPSLNLVKDLNSIQVSINQATYVYHYADIFSKRASTLYDAPQIKFQGKDGSYTRALYESDVYYSGEDKLRVKATYKIAIHNGSSSLTSFVNEIEDYYTNEYYGNNDHVAVGTDINNDGSIKKGTELKHELIAENENYYKMKITGPIEVGREDKYVYVQVEVKQEEIVNILEKNTLCNVAEVSSYSTQKDGQVYAAVDKYSRPGNVQLDDYKTYEWDTCKAPGLQLILQEERKLDGVVFEDAIKPEEGIDANTLMTEKIREGSGTYENSSDKTVKDVTVELVVTKSTGEIQYDENGDMQIAQLYQYVEVDSNDNIQYDEQGNVKLEDLGSRNGNWKWVDARYVTKEDGKYCFAGFIPDYYKVIYTWGGKHYIGGIEETIRVQDYKGTIYKERDRQSGKNGIERLEWYKYEKDTRYSDAMDNPETRKAIDNQSSTINYDNKTTIDANMGNMREYEEDGTEKEEKTPLITTMDSLTPTFRVNIEYEKNMDTSQEYQLDEKGAIVTNGSYAVKKEEYANYLKNVDFGIVERAKQVLRLDKEISWVKLTLANGTVLIDSEVEIAQNGNLKFKNEVKHAVCIPASEQAKAQIKMEIDNEIIQSAKLEVTYTLTVTNISEVDYVSDDYEYYFYGQGYGNTEDKKVTLQADKVIDYLDNNLAIDDANQVGNVVTGSTQILVEKGLYETVSELLKNTKKVLLIEDFTQALKSGEQEKQKIILSKLLSNIANDNEMVFDNSSEIVEVKKNGGSSLITIPGNYTQNLANSKEYDDDESATITILPPTGSDTNSNYITYTIIAISSLGILIVGIILIKKFVLK